MTLSMKTSLSVEKPGKNTDLSTKNGHFVEKVGKSWGESGEKWLLRDEAVEDFAGLAGRGVGGGVETGESGSSDSEVAQAWVV